MTKDEFAPELLRLCAGFKVEPTEERLIAYYTKLSWVDLSDWRTAVTALLCEPRYPLMDHVIKAIDEAQNQRHRVNLHRERAQAERFMAGGTILLRPWADPKEGAYNDFRLRLLNESMGHGFLVLSQRHAAGLTEWIQQPENEVWATRTPQEKCSYHPQPHTLWKCVVDEEAYWRLRVIGKTEEEARATLGLLTIKQGERQVCPQPRRIPELSAPAGRAR